MLNRLLSEPAPYKLGVILSPLLFLACATGGQHVAARADANAWECEVLPPERFITHDEDSGAELIFISRSQSADSNYYFHQRSWLSDGSILFFRTDRTGRGETFGYLEATGELVRIQRPKDTGFSHASAGNRDNRFYFVRDKSVFAWSFEIGISSNPEKSPSQVRVTEELVGALPADMETSLGINDSGDGRGVIVGFRSTGPHECRVVWLSKTDGAVREICAVDYPITHIQSSWQTPGLVMFARGYQTSDRPAAIPEGTIQSRMHLADFTDREPWPLYPQIVGELETHECWWVNDQVTFCTGVRHNGSAEESHVKVIDTATFVSRIIGAGSWWPGGSPAEVAHHNWWHCAGSPNGLWVAADNWHGEIALFSAKTSRTRILTKDHRTYGSGAHPHMGWSPSGDRLVFASNRFGNPDVCIVKVPKAWYAAW